MTSGERKRLGRNLRAARVAMGWTQKDVAKAARISQSDVSEIEQGVANPTLAKLERIARAVRRTVGRLFTD